MQRSFKVFLGTGGDEPFTDRRCLALRAFHAGLVACGLTSELVEGDAYVPCDVAVLFGTATAWPDTPRKRLRTLICERHPTSHVSLETPFLGRRIERHSRWRKGWCRLTGQPFVRLRDDYAYFRVGANGIFSPGAFNNDASPPDRWTALAREADIRVRPYRTRGRHVLVLGQVPNDASLGGTDIHAWIGDAVRTLRRHTDRPILVRPHPVSSRAALARFLAELTPERGVRIEHPPRGDMRAALRNCWAVVAHSSSGTIDALLAGIPAIATSPANIAWPVTDHELAAIEAPTLHVREQWLYNLAYAQWSVPEMACGSAWRHLAPVLLPPPRASLPDDADVPLRAAG